MHDTSGLETRGAEVSSSVQHARTMWPGFFGARVELRCSGSGRLVQVVPFVEWSRGTRRAVRGLSGQVGAEGK